MHHFFLNITARCLYFPFLPYQLYSIFFLAAATELKNGRTLADVNRALGAGVTAISKYGGASVGDRTMVSKNYTQCIKKILNFEEEKGTNCKLFKSLKKKCFTNVCQKKNILVATKKVI